MILFGCSLLLTVSIQILTSTFKRNTSKGAAFQEEFDTTVFNLPWKSTIKRPDRREVLHYAQQYEGKEIIDWYSPNVSSSIDKNITIALQQQSNISWEIGLRKMYRNFLLTYLITYTILLFAILVLLNIEALRIFLLVFSIMSFYTHFIGSILGHTESIRKKEITSNHLDDIIRRKKQITVGELRDIQDDIYLSRLDATKVPNFFFNLIKPRLEAESKEYIEEVNNLYKS